MDLFSNPFQPGAGSPPPALVGRDDLTAQIELALNRALRGRFDKGLMLTGLRGVGKTVLLNHFERKAEALGAVTIFLEAPEDESFRAKLARELGSTVLRLHAAGGAGEKVARALRVLKSFSLTAGINGSFTFGVDIAPERGTADTNDPELDLRDLLLAVGEAAKERSTALFIAIDEIQYLNGADFGALISAIHRVVQRELPIVVAGAGLPNLAGLAGEAKTYAERLFDFRELGALSPSDVRCAIAEPAAKLDVEFTDDALDAIADVTQGYAYFVQEWAHDAWKAAKRSPITIDDVFLASVTVEHRLDRSFFRVRFDRLTPKEQHYLRAMAELGPGPHATGDIAAAAGAKSSSSVSRIRDALIRKGMIYAPDHGSTAFTVPLFDRFMKRALPSAVAIDALPHGISFRHHAQ